MLISTTAIELHPYPHLILTSSNFSAFLAERMRIAPFVATCCENSSPIPLEAPVTHTTYAVQVKGTKPNKRQYM